MSLFHYHSFVIGAVFSFIMSLDIFVYALLSVVWKFRITKVSIFAGPRFSLYKKMKNGILYNLGWLPFSSYVQPLGMLKEDYEQLSRAEQLHAFYGKPRIIKMFFLLVPTFIWVAVLLAALCLLQPQQGLPATVSEMAAYLSSAWSAIWGHMPKPEFAALTKATLAGKHVVTFAIVICSFLLAVGTPLMLLVQLLTEGGPEKGKIAKIAGNILLLLYCYFFGWKVLVFVFSFFPAGNNVIYVINYVLGLYAMGPVAYALVLLLVSPWLGKAQPAEIVAGT